MYRLILAIVCSLDAMRSNAAQYAHGLPNVPADSSQVCDMCELFGDPSRGRVDSRLHVVACNTGGARSTKGYPAGRGVEGLTCNSRSQL